MLPGPGVPSALCLQRRGTRKAQKLLHSAQDVLPGGDLTSLSRNCLPNRFQAFSFGLYDVT